MLTLDAALPGLLAEDRLREHGIRGLEPDTVYDLMMLATGDADQADDLRIERIQQIMDERSG